MIRLFRAWVGAICLVGISAGSAEILILDKNGEAVLVAAQEVREEKKIIQFKELDGTKREVELGKVLGKLPSTPLPEQELSREQAVSAINKILEAKAQHPNLEQPLHKELEIWKERLDKMPSPEDPEALAKAEAAFAAATGKAIPQVYDGKKSYTTEELAKQVEALAALSKEFPERAQEVENIGAPWRLEMENQQAGRKKFEGRWFEPEDWEKEKETRNDVAKKAFLAKIQAPAVAPILFSQGVFVAGLGLVLGGALLGLSFLFHGVVELLRHRAWWKGTAWALAGMGLFSLMARATVLAIAVPEPPLVLNKDNRTTLEDLLWSQAGLKEALPAEVKLSDAEINDWWGRRLRFAVVGVTDILAVSTERWQLEFVEGGMTLDRTGRWLGQNLVLRHELIFSRSEKGENIYRVEASLGKLPLPPALVLRTWNQWVDSLLEQVALFPGSKSVQLDRIEKGVVIFTTQ